MKPSDGPIFASEESTTTYTDNVADIVDLLHRQLDIVEKLCGAHVIIPAESGEPR